MASRYFVVGKGNLAQAAHEKCRGAPGATRAVGPGHAWDETRW